MGKQLQGLLYFYVADIRHSLVIFWSILLTLLLLSIGVAYFFLGEMDSLNFDIAFPTYIYCSIVGFLTVKGNIPFSIKMGATRKNIFISIGLYFLGLSLGMALVSNSINSIVKLLVDNFTINSFYFAHIATFIQDTWINRVMIDMIIMFFFLSLMFLIGLFFYKFGLLGGLSLIGLIVFGFLIGVTKGWLIDFIIHVFNNLGTQFFLQLLACGLALYGLSFLLIRRITIVKAR